MKSWESWPWHVVVVVYKSEICSAVIISETHMILDKSATCLKDLRWHSLRKVGASYDEFLVYTKLADNFQTKTENLYKIIDYKFSPMILERRESNFVVLKTDRSMEGTVPVCIGNFAPNLVLGSVVYATGYETLNWNEPLKHRVKR